MSEKKLQTRIQLSHDSSTEWASHEEDKFVLPGEVIVVDDPENGKPMYFVIGGEHNGEKLALKDLPKFYPIDPEDITGEVDLENYYTKTETDAKISSAIEQALGIALNETTYPTSNS